MAEGNHYNQVTDGLCIVRSEVQEPGRHAPEGATPWAVTTRPPFFAQRDAKQDRDTVHHDDVGRVDEEAGCFTATVAGRIFDPRIGRLAACAADVKHRNARGRETDPAPSIFESRHQQEADLP